MRKRKMYQGKMYQVFLAFAGLFLLATQPAWAVSNISPQAAHDNAAAGNGIIIDVRTVEEHNGCQAVWDGTTCPNPEVENDGHPEWTDTATGVIVQPPNVPFWISDPGSGQSPEDPVEFAAAFELLRNAGVISYNSPVYLICRSGFRSYWAGIFLEGQGYTNVYTVDSDGLGGNDGGMLEWYAAGLPQLSIFMPPQIYSVSPADGEVLPPGPVTFTVGIMEPTWGTLDPYASLKAYVDRVSLYIDGVQTTDIILPVGTPGTGLWTEFTFTETLTSGPHVWNVEAVDEYGEPAFNPYSIDLGPGDRTLTIAACTDSDNDGYSPDGGDCGLVDCNDNDATVYPGADDSQCDGVDNNCDGAVDEGYVSVATSCGVGECVSTGTTICVNGSEGDTCTPGAPTGNDADCNGLDEDCDGVADNNYVPVETTCGVGECASTGTTTCVNGSEGDTCTPGAPTGDDADCNGLDEDCDGVADNNYVPVETTCGVGECASTGTTSCVDGSESDTCTPGAPTGDDADCNGLDEDCDGVADNNYVPVETTCGVGECASTGLIECVDGATNDTCTPGAPVTEICDDGLDNDCDGFSDAADSDCGAVDYYCDSDGDGAVSSSVTGTCLGVGCQPAECLTTAGNDCNDSDSSVYPGADDSQCDGVDNNCDGAVDEGYTPTSTTCGVGSCESTGLLECVNGSEVNSCVAGAPGVEGPFGDPTCADSVDNDCDGATDADDSDCVELCIPTGDDSNCDGIDDDCDGVADNNYVPTDTTCGIGVCASTGLIECINGSEVNSCVEGAPTGDDSDCNGIDDDCDGVADNNYVPAATTCGLGACESTGESSCVDGVEIDTCTPGTPAVEGPVGDPTCSDAIDNDCDGATDTADTDCGLTCTDVDNDGYAIEGGDCGPVDCNDGNAAVNPGTDEVCDGLDNDCDGDVDEGFDADGDGYTTCGGDCDDDNPAVNLAATEGPFEDPTCSDGLDNDCDGRIDLDDRGCQEVEETQPRRRHRRRRMR